MYYEVAWNKRVKHEQKSNEAEAMRIASLYRPPFINVRVFLFLINLIFDYILSSVKIRFGSDELTSCHFKLIIKGLGRFTRMFQTKPAFK